MKRVLLFIIVCCFALALTGCAVGADAGMDGVSVSAGPDGSMENMGSNLDRDLADDGIVNGNTTHNSGVTNNDNNDLITDGNLNTRDNDTNANMNSNVTNNDKHNGSTATPDGAVS